MLRHMRKAPVLLRLLLMSGLTLSAACATPRAREEAPRGAPAVEAGHRNAWTRADGTPEVEVASVLLQSLPGERLQLSFPASVAPSETERLRPEEVRPLLTAFNGFRPQAKPRLRLMMEWPVASVAGQGTATAWERRLREDFLSLYGPALLPLPESLETSRLYIALKLSTRYMGGGFREAAQELFSAPAFLASICLSVVVYFAAWLAPEPFFSKAFAAALTVRLSLLVGLVELGRIALACLRLYQEAEAATSQQELEGAAERFGKAVGGTGLRVLVVVATLGVPQVLPQVPQGSVWTLLSPLRHAPAGGVAMESIATAQVVTDGAILVTGVAAGTSAVSLCGELAMCAVREEASGGSKLSTRYGPPHTRKNPPHNEAIEEELARREAAGHTDLRKNEAQVNAAKKAAFDNHPVKGIRFRRPDASSVRPDGVRHNTNYVSNPRDMKREIEAFQSMSRADPRAIHELYLLDGTLVRRYVPSGVSFP